MFGTYLRRELLGRRKQTIIIAVGMALAIALVIVVSAVSAGVRDAQAQVLRSVYGIGTDIVVTKPAAAPGAPGEGGQRFRFGAGTGTASGGSRTVNTSRLTTGFGTQTLDASTLGTVARVRGVTQATAVLTLTNTSFSGTLPNFGAAQGGGRAGGGSGAASSGGTDGTGGSAFKVDSFSVLGVTPGTADVGPLSATAVSKGRALSASDDGKLVAVLDSNYATSNKLGVGDTLSVAGKNISIVGTLSPSDSDSATAADVYLPLATAQSLSGDTGKITAIYVRAASASDISTVTNALGKAVSGVTVATQADLAATVSGSLGNAGALMTSLGTWLLLIVLAAAFLIAILFTISGVSRRIRDFGTLKALGWTNRRIIAQVSGESITQGLIGGVAGAVLGLIGVLVINLVPPTLTGGVNRGSRFAQATGRALGASGTGGNGGSGAFGGGGGAAARRGAAAMGDLALHAPVTVWVILAAVGLAVLGGLLAGAIGGWRASRMRPADALRSIA